MTGSILFTVGVAFLVTCLSAGMACKSVNVTLNVFLSGCPLTGTADTLNLTLDTKALASWSLLSFNLPNSSVSVMTLLHDANNVTAVKTGRINLFIGFEVIGVPTLADFGLLPFGPCGLCDWYLHVSGGSRFVNPCFPI